MVETKLVLPSRLEPLLDEPRDDAGEAGGDGLCDEGPLLHQVAGHVHLVPLACQVQERVLAVSLGSVFAVQRHVDVELHLLHQVLDDVDVAGRAGGENERRVVEEVEVGAVLDEVAEDAQLPFDAGDEERAEPAASVLELGVVVHEESDYVHAAYLGGSEYRGAEWGTDVRVDPSFEEVSHGVVLTLHAGVEDGLFDDSLGNRCVGVLRLVEEALGRRFGVEKFLESFRVT